MSISELMGKRCLLKLGTGYNYKRADEYKVVEGAPSGNWVKLQNIHGAKFWTPVTECSLVEVLQDIRPEPPPTS